MDRQGVDALGFQLLRNMRFCCFSIQHILLQAVFWRPSDPDVLLLCQEKFTSASWWWILRSPQTPAWGRREREGCEWCRRQGRAGQGEIRSLLQLSLSSHFLLIHRPSRKSSDQDGAA